MHPSAAPHIAIIGAGWAGCAAAVRAVQMGAHVSLFEASRTPGGRARSVPCADADGGQIDNGQHILIGAYTQTLALMRTVGASPEELLLRLPLDLRTPNGHGLHLRPAPSAQLAALRAILQAKGWAWGEKWRLLRTAMQWQRQGFTCPAQASVADLCQGLGPVVISSLIEPLCVAAFNSAPHETSGTVFLRVLQDALFSSPGAADALIARQPFGQLLPEPALAWLQARGAHIHLGQRVMALRPVRADAVADSAAVRWQLQCGQAVDAHTDSHAETDCAPNHSFDQVILACPAWEAARLIQGLLQNLPQSLAQNLAPQPDNSESNLAPYSHTAPGSQPTSIQHGQQYAQQHLPHHLQQWAQKAAALQHVPIATVYAWCPSQACAHLPPMQALLCQSKSEAQFAFHHAQRQHSNAQGERQTLLSFVASHCSDDRQALERAITAQAQAQLGLPPLHIIRTTLEKRATFICSPALQRPPMQIASGLLACGDYVQGPYPATLEGAVRSGLQAAEVCCA